MYDSDSAGLVKPGLVELKMFITMAVMNYSSSCALENTSVATSPTHSNTEKAESECPPSGLVFPQGLHLCVL